MKETMTREKMNKLIEDYIRVHAEYMYYTGIFNCHEEKEYRDRASRMISAILPENSRLAHETDQAIMWIAEEEDIKYEDVIDNRNFHAEACKIAEEMRNANGIYINNRKYLEDVCKVREEMQNYINE